MSAAAAERVRSAREVKCATHSSPQQLARGALLSALRPRTLRAPTLFYVPAVLSLAPALRLGGGHFGAGSARSGNKPNPGARACAGILHPCASRAPTSQKVDDKSHSPAMCVLVPQSKGGFEKYECGKSWPVDRFVAERYVKGVCQFLVLWKGYDHTFLTWEEVESILDKAMVRAWNVVMHDSTHVAQALDALRGAVSGRRCGPRRTRRPSSRSRCPCVPSASSPSPS